MTASVWPNLGYRDAPAAIRFLEEAFGFEAAAVYDGPTKGSVGHAELRWPGGGGITLHSAAAGKSVADLCADAGEDGYPPFSIHVDTDDPDAVFARARARGAVVVRELDDSPFGTRGFIAQDPEGLYWSFGTPLPRLVRHEHGWRPADSASPPDPR
jgi:uncharacterized glyoxalase superfamily protein PhnB